MVEGTIRTTQGRYLLRPSDELNQLTIGILARAQKLTGAEVHAFTYLSNHGQHTASFVDVEQMANFNQYVNGNLAREVGRLHDWNAKFWSRRYKPIPVSDEVEAQTARLKYILAQGCIKEGLIRSPLDWPGATSTLRLYNGHRTMTGIWVDRDGLRRARQRYKDVDERDFTTVEELELTPIPALAHLSHADYMERIQELVHEIESEAEIENRARGRTPLGAKRIQQVHPHTRPDHLDRSPAPRFHAKRREVLQAMRESFNAFLGLYRAAAEELKAGDANAEFPIGCFPPRLPFTHPKLVPD